MNDYFYRAFEEKHRGSRDLIKARLEIYLPFILPLKNRENAPKSLDVGCGRGEWLELLGSHGFDPMGVDLDEGMLEACLQKNLKVEKKDALNALSSLEDETLSIVSGFHLVEHLPLEDLHTLIHQSYRVLKPGGILILETPNPENIVVGTSAFYLDPTHVKPIPHELLSFMAEYYAFHRVKVVRLQENPELLTLSDPSLLEVLYGVSPDYAIVAQKKGPDSMLTDFDHPFETPLGLGLEELVSRYDRRFAEVQALAAHALTQAHEAHQQIETLRHTFLHSRSWRLTAPLRSLGSFMRTFKIDRKKKP